MFKNPGRSVKSVARVMFVICLVLAITLFCIGGIRFLSVVDFGDYPSFGEVLAYTAEDYAYGIAHEYEWYVEGYLAKVQCQNAIILAIVSLSCIPLYAFGCMVEDIAQIKEKMNDYTK